MTSEQIRKQFLDFFKNKNHKIVPSAPVVPFNDPTLLFVNAGMNQFKDVFLGKGKRDYSRAADTQKCIRVSGKHNDLEEVGYDTYHHTFFEMLGNWSFGDYYKEEAIVWAWELLTDVWKLPKNRLWATVFNDDDEAFDLWKSKTAINPDHILRFGEKDNFWEMGDTGPCGPCSEIHINLSDDFNNPKLVNAGLPECIELWNLVFIQYDRDENGKLHNLPHKHVDTGMGFERMCAVLQKKKSNYETDVFTPLIDKIANLSGITDISEKTMIPMRVIADHIRTLTFAIADGASPGNEGRGYVLRRILRRAARYGRKLNLNDPFMFKLVDTLVKTMSHVFPEIKEKEDYIKKIIKAEEESFNATLDRGIELFDQIVLELIQRQSYNFDHDKIFRNRYDFMIKNDNKTVIINERTKEQQAKLQHAIKKTGWSKKERYGKYKYEINIDHWTPVHTKKFFKEPLVIGGDNVFKLYDTYGFPVDLTRIMAHEKGFEVDEAGFNKLMEAQKKKGRDASKSKLDLSTTFSTNHNESYKILSGDTPTEFTGYKELTTDATIIGHKRDKDFELVVLDRTPFYVEAGGQIDDLGKLKLDSGEYEIIDVTKIDNNTIHILQNTPEGIVKKGKKVIAEVDEQRRWDIMRNHSATHFLHAALRKVLGTHVQQAGSYVGPDHLRFDFNHIAKVSPEELRDIEALVNEELRRNYALQHHRNIPFEEATKMGALMFFGDKYGDKVNVVQFGDFTMEFCGGTHVQNSSQIGLFKIVSESSIASGTRRIEAVTGSGVERYIDNQILFAKKQNDKIEKLLDSNKNLEKELTEYKLKDKLGQLDHILALASHIKGVEIFKGKVVADSMDELKSFGDDMRNKIKSGIGVLVAQIEDKAGIVAVVSDDLIKEKKLSAGKIVGELAKLVGGGGGGKPHLATAGGKDIKRIPEAISTVEEVVKKLL